MAETEEEQHGVSGVFACTGNVVVRHTMQKKKSGANMKTQSVWGRQSYQSRLVKWLTLENEKKTTVSQDWRHKKEKNIHIKVLV